MAAHLLADLRAAGFSLVAEGDRLLVSPASRLTDELRRTIREHKPDLLACLRAEAAGMPTEDWESSILAWLVGIGEDDPNPVLEHCRRDLDARAYFLSHARRWARREKVAEWLSKNPSLRLAVVVEEETERYVATVAVRGKGVVDLAIDRDRYDGLALLELVERHGGSAWPKMEAAA